MCRKLLLELFHFSEWRYPVIAKWRAGSQHAASGFDLLFIHVVDAGEFERQRLSADGGTAEERQFAVFARSIARRLWFLICDHGFTYFCAFAR